MKGCEPHLRFSIASRLLNSRCAFQSLISKTSRLLEWFNVKTIWLDFITIVCGTLSAIYVSIVFAPHLWFLFVQAWEDQFRDKMMKLRNNEFHWLSQSNKTRSLGTILYWMTPVLVSSITFGAYILLGHKLSPAVVFTSLSAFRIIQDPVRVVPELLAIIIQVWD